MKYDIEFNEADYCKAAEVPLKTNPEEEIQLPAKVKSGNRGDKE